MNMLATIVPKSDQLNADDLIGRSMTIEITDAKVTPGEEQPVALSFKGDDRKPYKPGKSMRRVLVQAWGPDAKAYIGRSLTLFRDDKVQFGGLAVGGIRISHMTHLRDNKPLVMALTATRGNKRAFEVRPLELDEDAKIQAGVDALVERIAAAADQAALEAITRERDVVRRRAWLRDNWRDLAERVDAAVASRLDALDAAAEGAPGEHDDARDAMEARTDG